MRALTPVGPFSQPQARVLPGMRRSPNSGDRAILSCLQMKSEGCYGPVNTQPLYSPVAAGSWVNPCICRRESLQRAIHQSPKP